MADVQTFIERGRLLLQQSRVNEAVKQLEQALAIDPDNDEALAIMARCKFDVKDYQAGIDLLNNALQIDPENTYYFYLLGFGFYKLNNNAKAIQYLETSIHIDPYFAESFGLLAYIYIEEIKFDKALENANTGLAIEAENITCLNARSIALNKLKRVDEAEETMQDALSKDPDNEYTHATIGWNYIEKGKHILATNHFREALRINPNYSSAKAGLKEAIKSKIPPYKWLLQYSYWYNNQSQKFRWIIPVSLFIVIRIIANLTPKDGMFSSIGAVVVSLYLLFVITSWIINPIANFFLLFHKDGKYALTATEKYTSITVISSLLKGLVFILLSAFVVSAKLEPRFSVTAICFFALCLPLGSLYYPLSFIKYGTQNKIALILVALGLSTIILLHTYYPAALIVGACFAILLIINNWLGIFR
jgi:tetratricopeptide (TPR) repeat protein